MMANTIGTLEKKILGLVNDLSNLLTTYKYDEAWQVAGELNSVLKSSEVIQLPADMLEAIRVELKGYYFTNSEIQSLHKRLVAKGHKLADLANSI